MNITIRFRDAQNMDVVRTGRLPFRIGRDPEQNELELSGETVSRTHCTLELRGAEIVVVNHARYGLRVNGEKVLGEGAVHPVPRHATLKIGQYYLEVDYDSWASIDGPQATLSDTVSEKYSTRTEVTLVALAGRRGARRVEAVRLLDPQKGAPGRKFIVVEDVAGGLGPRWTSDLELRANKVTLGRGVAADILLDDPRISRIHASLAWVDDRIEVEDAGSHNGIHLNGVRLYGRCEVPDNSVLTARPFTILVNRAGDDVILRIRGLEGEPQPDVTMRTEWTGSVGLSGDFGAAMSGATQVVAPGDLIDVGSWKPGKTAPHWQATSDLRKNSTLGALMAVTLASAAVVIACVIAARGPTAFSPGRVSHPEVDGQRLACAQCHMRSAASVNPACNGCHPALESPVATGVDFPIVHGSPHLKSGSALEAAGASDAAGPGTNTGVVACTECHSVHQGEPASLRAPSADRCLGCHSEAHKDDTAMFAPFTLEDRSDLQCSSCHLEHVPPERRRPGDVEVTSAIMGAGGVRTRPVREGMLPIALLLLAILGPSGGLGLYQYRKLRATQSVDQKQSLDERFGILPPPPVARVPIIDPLKCVGCNACVDACPYGVLKVENALAKVVSEPNCHGVAYCEAKCPKDAISFKTMPKKGYIPPITERFESQLVKGMFIVGNLAGLPLIKVAIDQGTLVTELIAEQRRARADILDVVIIGSGPAGLAASVTAATLGLRYVTLEQGDVAHTIRHFPRQKLVMAYPFELPLLGKVYMGECTKEELIDRWDRLLEEKRVQIRTNEKVTDVQLQTDGTFIVTSIKDRYVAGSVILAIGTSGEPNKLRVPGEDQKKVMYALEDAQQWRGKRIIVVGGGDVAMEAMLALCHQPDTEVTLVHYKNQIDAGQEANRRKVAEAMREGSLRALWMSSIKEIRPDEVVITTTEGPDQKREQILRNDIVFIMTGSKPPVEFLKRVGVIAPD